MRPTLLEIDGLLSYKSYQQVDFSTIEFAAIVGENGAGKSSLLDCMMFALFGTVYGGNMDWILSTGVDEGYASLEFDFDGHSWKVTRTRTRAKRTVAQLARWEEDSSSWGVIAEGSVRAVDLEIERLLRVDETAFRATVMLAQNEAAAFSSAGPAERKEILGKIVGLDRYSRLADAAKERATTAKTNAGTKRAVIEQVKRRLVDEDAHVYELGVVSGDLVDAETTRNESEKLASAADDERREKEEAVNALRNAIESRREALHAQSVETENAYQEALSEYNDATAKHEAAQTELDELEGAAETSAEVLQQLQDNEALVRTINATIDELVTTGQKEADITKSLTAEHATLVAQRTAAEERLTALDGGDVHGHTDGECWLCGTALTAEQQESLLQDAKGSVAELDRLATAKENEVADKERHVESLRQKLRTEKKTRDDKLDEAKKLGTLLEARRDAEKRSDKVHGDFVAAVKALSAATSKLERRQKARFNVDADPQLIKATERLRLAEDALAGFPGGATHRARAATAAAQVRTLSSRKAVLESKLEQMEEDKKELARLERELEAFETEERKFVLLRKAFGRNGIPALIYAGVVDELNEHINDILGYLSDGQLSVELTTTKVTGKGTLSETLEVMIVAPDGVRPYASFSGGEKFRIDIAIRLGLSRLLANRHGAKLEFLAIDEGWGSLDPQGIAAMISELNKLRSEFSLILTVTHIDAIREGFGTLIHVTKTAGGSQIEIE
jgi:DNA repair exonuclease SbcCD ATPase subunit